MKMDIYQAVKEFGFPVGIALTFIAVFLGMFALLVKFILDTVSKKLDRLIETNKCNIPANQLEQIRDAITCMSRKLTSLLTATYLKAAGQDNPYTEDLRKILIEKEGEDPPCPPKVKEEAKAE